MVTCNICIKGKSIKEIEGMFRYVCKSCWKRIKIIDENGIELNKENFY